MLCAQTELALWLPCLQSVHAATTSSQVAMCVLELHQRAAAINMSTLAAPSLPPLLQQFLAEGNTHSDEEGGDSSDESESSEDSDSDYSDDSGGRSRGRGRGKGRGRGRGKAAAKKGGKGKGRGKGKAGGRSSRTSKSVSSSGVSAHSTYTRLQG